MFRVFALPNRWAALALSWLLFTAAALFYLQNARTRHLENPDDRIVPTVKQLAAGFERALTTPAEDSETIIPDDAGFFTKLRGSMLVSDTVASARRFAVGLFFLFPAALLGMQMGLFPWVGSFFLRPFIFFDKIVALSLLPILFIAFGIGEAAKIMLIVIGVAPTLVLDGFNLAKSVPGEQVVKSFTLGARDWTVAWRVVLPQIWPRLLNSIRLNLKAVALFLFAGEMIASTDGLAYRIALLQRHMGMDLIIPYVLWAALLLFLLDQLFRWATRLSSPWFKEA